MGVWIKTGVTALSIGGLAGASVAGYSHFSRNSFKDKLGESVLSLTGEENKTQWTARFKELSETTETNLLSDLSNLKTGKTWKNLQTWCLNNSSNKFEKDTETKYQNFETFCTWKIGDKEWGKKIPATTNETDEKWGTAHKALQNKTKLSESLTKVKETKAESNNNADKKAMHKWCTDSYKKTWMGSNDKNFKEIETYCQA